MEHYVSSGDAKIWTFVSDDDSNCNKLSPIY